MKTQHLVRLFLLVWLPMGVPTAAIAQNTVTIPKSRLEELEQKERELERLKGDVTKTQDENAQLKTRLEQATTNRMAATPARISPPLASLPPLRPEEVVESIDLANYYQADLAAANKRYREQKLTVRGEIVGFDKPIFVRNYKIYLLGSDRATRVVCDFVPPDNIDAVFPVNNGSEMVNVVGDTRVPIAKVGQTVLVTGECKGWHKGMVLLLASHFQPVR